MKNYNLNVEGMELFENYFSESEMLRLVDKFDLAIEQYNKMKSEKGIGEQGKGTLHQPLVFDTLFTEILDLKEPLFGAISDWFNGPFILNTYGGVLNEQTNSAYVHGIHRDTRFYCGEHIIFLNLLIPLNDFTLENGATHILRKENNCVEEPSEEYFNEKSERMLLKAGDVMLFDSNLWHRAGENHTDVKRRCITMTFSRPWVKPQFDFSSSQKINDESPEHLKQLLGFYSRTPSTMEEFLLPEDKRFHRRNQNFLGAKKNGS